MIRAHLHLVNAKAEPLSSAVQAACEAAFRWAVREYPDFDQAQLSNWTEELGMFMEERQGFIASPRRYASVTLLGKVRDWQRTASGRVELKGVGAELEQLVGGTQASSLHVERKRLFEQVQRTLSERDRAILTMLLTDQPIAKIAAFLDTNYAAAAKAVQRVKDRMSAVVEGKRQRHETSDSA